MCTQQPTSNPVFEETSKLVLLKNKHKLALAELAISISSKKKSAPDKFVEHELEKLFQKIMEFSERETVENQTLNAEPIFKLHSVT